MKLTANFATDCLIDNGNWFRTMRDIEERFDRSDERSIVKEKNKNKKYTRVISPDADVIDFGG